MPETSIRFHQSPIIEIIHVSDSLAGSVEGAGKVLKLVSAAEAFRRYDWLRGVPFTNISGNLRGMVISAKWKAIFETTSDTLETIGKITLIAGFAANIADQAGSIGSIIHSDEPAYMKGLRLTTIAGTAAERTLLSPVSAGSSLLSKSLQGYCMMAGLPGGRAQTFSTACVSNLQKANNIVQSKFKLVTDTNNQAKAIYWITAKVTGR